MYLSALLYPPARRWSARRRDSQLVKNPKRYAAAEHSRVLSEKVFAGQCRLIELGYRMPEPDEA